MAVPLENGGAIMVATLLTRAKSSLLGQHVWDLATVPADALLAELETEGGPRRCLFDVVQRVEAARAQHARGGN